MPTLTIPGASLEQTADGVEFHIPDDAQILLDGGRPASAGPARNAILAILTALGVGKPYGVAVQGRIDEEPGLAGALALIRADLKSGADSRPNEKHDLILEELRHKLTGTAQRGWTIYAQLKDESAEGSRGHCVTSSVRPHSETSPSAKGDRPMVAFQAVTSGSHTSSAALSTKAGAGRFHAGLQAGRKEVEKLVELEEVFAIDNKGRIYGPTGAVAVPSDLAEAKSDSPIRNALNKLLGLRTRFVKWRKPITEHGGIRKQYVIDVDSVDSADFPEAATEFEGRRCLAIELGPLIIEALREINDRLDAAGIP